MNIVKQVQFVLHKTIGNEKLYFQTQDDIILDNSKKLLSKYSSYDNSLDDNSLDYDSIDDDSLDDDSIDNSEIVENIISFMPMEVTRTKIKNINDINKKNIIKEKEVSQWLIFIKTAKHHFDLAGIPYDWISNDGKVKIHKKARDLYLKKYEKKQKEILEIKKIYQKAQFEINIEKLRSMKIPNHDPIITQKKN